MRTLTLCLALLRLLNSCVPQRYVGVQIASSAPMEFTCLVADGRAVVVCKVDP
ncbi:Uncharacterised protein [Enterobacter kobei]|nr:Uncharacterised protein [Enterobacter kobei]